MPLHESHSLMGTPRSKFSGRMHAGRARWLVRWSRRVWKPDWATVELCGRSKGGGERKIGSGFPGACSMQRGWMVSTSISLMSLVPDCMDAVLFRLLRCAMFLGMRIRFSIGVCAIMKSTSRMLSTDMECTFMSEKVRGELALAALMMRALRDHTDLCLAPPPPCCA
jgi:hypothetical protein